jgi:hypothetical protein
MGWKDRAWFLGIDPGRLFDRAENIGPTLWWDGEVVGSWAVTSGGEVRTVLVADRGAEARDAIIRAADCLRVRLAGTVVTPAVRTPLERSIADEAVRQTQAKARPRRRRSRSSDPSRSG